MERYIAILRGINVSGKRKILMKDLKQLFQSAGFQNIQTYVQSGNVIFDSEETRPSDLETRIEELIAEKYGFQVSVIIIKPEQLNRIIAENPFTPNEDTIKQNYLVLLKEAPAPDKVKELNSSSFKDEFEMNKKYIYIKYRTKYSDSKLNNNFIENKLKVTASTRNWKTVLKLSSMA